MFLYKVFLWVSWVLFFKMNFIKSGRIVGNVIRKNNMPYENLYITTKLLTNQNYNFEITSTNNDQCVINNKNNLVYCENDKELFLEENNFIKGKKLISISPGGLKGFYELGVLSFIKESYDMENYIYSGASAGSWNALFMCYKNDNKKFVYTLMKDLKLLRVKSIKELE